MRWLVGILAGWGVGVAWGQAPAWACSCPTYLNETVQLSVLEVELLEGDIEGLEQETARWSGSMTLSGSLGSSLRLRLEGEVDDGGYQRVDLMFEDTDTDTDTGGLP